MAVTGNFLKLYNMMGNYRNLLSSRIILPNYQPVATLKQSVEERLGLPRKPKRPLSPYFQFMKNTRPSIVEKYPTLKLVEITKILAQEWQRADEKLKARLKQEYDLNFKRYQDVITQYYSSFTEDQRQLLEKGQLEEKHAQQKRRLHKQLKSLGKPTRPPTSFTLWVKSLKAKRGSMSLSEFQKTLATKWEALPQKEKELFELKAAQEMHDYKINLQNWKEKMSLDPNHDLAKYGVKINPQTTEKKQSPE